MRKSNTIDGAIDKLELCETELQSEIERMKDTKRITLSIFHSLSNALDRRALSLRSIKRIMDS
jgi:hypothetical protein